MVRWLRWHCPPDTGFEIRALAVWGRVRYLSVTEAPHNTDCFNLRKTLTRWWLNVGPPSTTVVQHQANIGSTSVQQYLIAMYGITFYIGWILVKLIHQCYDVGWKLWLPDILISSNDAGNYSWQIQPGNPYPEDIMPGTRCRTRRWPGADTMLCQHHVNVSYWLRYASGQHLSVSLPINAM